MILARKMRTVSRLPLRDIRMVVEAWLELHVARCIIAVLPFRVYAPRLRGRVFDAPVSAELVRDVGWAVGCAARNAPIAMQCLVQAMAAKAMLSRRRHTSVLHLGVKLGGTRLEAHAWLTVGAMIVVGGGTHGFGEVASFGGAGNATRREPREQDAVKAASAIQPDAA